MLEAKNIHKAYHNGRKTLEILKGVDVSIEQGKIAAIAGPSGAGKSTLLHILGGLDTPSKGKVIFENEDMYSLSEASLARMRNRRIGFVFQFYHLLSEFTVFENVLIPSRINTELKLKGGELKEKALRLLKVVGLEERVTHFPSQLSGGEKQRVAIVRGLMNDPALLLCDEPTGNLDSKTGDEIIALLKKINRDNQMTLVLVTHNTELARIADCVYHLRDGVLAH